METHRNLAMRRNFQRLETPKHRDRITHPMLGTRIPKNNVPKKLGRHNRRRSPRRKKLSELELPDQPLILVAEGIEKPGNIGALLRTADGAGVDAVIIADAATDLNNPKVIRNSIGTLFYLPVAEATSEETIAYLKQRNIRRDRISPVCREK